MAAIEAKFFANLCRALGASSGSTTSTTTTSRTTLRRDFAAAFARRDRDDWVAELSGADTCVAPVQAVAEIGADPQYAWRGAVVEAKHAGRGAVPSGGAGAGRAWRRWPSRCACPTPAVTDTDELLAAAGVAGRRGSPSCAPGRVVA